VASLRRVLSPDYLFVTYPGKEAHKRLYFPPWVEKTLRAVFPSGVIRFGKYWVLIVSGVATAETLESSPDRLRALLAETRGQFPGIEVIALAGRLSGVAEKTGVGLERPFIHGDLGTVCAMVGAADELARLAGKPTEETTIALVGSGGFIGSRLVASLAERFRQVIAIDPRFGEPSENGNGVVYTDRPEDVAEAETVLILTARGSDTNTLTRYLRPGTFVADDTHPEIAAPLRASMEERGATVLKAAVADDRIRIVPRIPTFRADDVPGCLLEALVVVQRGSEVLESQAAFNRAAEELGFRARLAPHLPVT
jgi:predicted amino acid dehydrogenase